MVTTFRHGLVAKCYVHNQDLSPYLESLDLEQPVDTGEIKTIGSTAVQRVKGHQGDAILTLAGVHDAATELAIYNAFHSASIDGCFAVMYDGDTAGNAAYLGVVKVQADGAQSPQGAVKMPVKALGTHQLERGISLSVLAAHAASGSTDSRDDRPAGTSSSGCHVYIICTAISAVGATLTCKIEHSINNADWNDLVAFTNITTAGGATSERVATTGDVRRYIKVTWTITADKSATFFVGWKRL